MKRFRRTRRHGACLVLGCACILHAARGEADWESVPDITLEAEANDNPTLNSGLGGLPGELPEIDSTSRLLADVVLRLRNAGPRAELTFEPRVRRDMYAEDEAQALESTDVFLRSSGVHRGQTVRVGYLADIARERIVGVEFFETLPTEPVIDDPTAIATNQLGANERRTRLGISPYVEIAFNSRSSLRLDGRIVDVDYAQGASAGRTDFLERAIGGEFRRSLDERGSLGVRVFATGYEASVNNNVTDTRGIELVYARELSELWSWSISAGTQRSDFALSSGGRRIRGTDDTGVFGLNFSKRGERSGMRAELQRRMSPDALGFVAPRDELRVSWERTITPRVMGRVGVRAIDAAGLPTVADSGRRFGRAELDVEWQFRQQWWLVAGYAHATARSEGSSNSAGSNSLTLGVRYRGRSMRPGAFAQ